jgi:predicted nucleic acid-binding protein
MFWDSSAIVPLLVAEAQSDAMTRILAGDTEPVIWWATPLECQSAVQRRHRVEPFKPAHLTAYTDRLRQFVHHADTVAPTDDVRRRAARLLAVHPLRAADALQLAAALVWAEEQPHGEMFVSLDQRLREAAGREGFSLIPPELEVSGQTT